MGFEAQDTARLVVLMLAGALICAVGLYILLKPKPEGGTAKIELFGLKFESSSAGLLVFLIGAAFFASPLFVPEKERSEIVVATQNEGAPAARADVVENAKPASPALLLPPEPDVIEREPNDELRDANQFAMGSIVKGVAQYDFFDWYVVPIDLPAHQKVEFKLMVASGDWARAEVFDAREIKLDTITVNDGAKYHSELVAQNDRFYIRVHGSREPDYELSVRLLAE